MCDREGMKRKGHTLHQSMHLFLDDLEPTCTARFCARAKSNMKQIRFPIFASYVVIVPKVRMLVGFGAS